ncbi:MAG: IS110 family transposase [Verrucomicrobiales bacterium]|nr:IS110 family transposase [Verrucomicrobiales bacterium]
MNQSPAQPPFDLVIGLDRSDAKADLCLIDVLSGKRRHQTIATAPEALATWIAKLCQAHPNARIALALEQPAGNLIPFFEAYSWLTLYALNPMTLKKYREAFVTSRAKDDLRDADFLADLLLRHHDKLTPWAPQDEKTRLIQQLVYQRRAVVDQRTALTNELQAILKQYFPQALDLCGEDLWRPLATTFLLKWPTLQAVRKAPAETVRRFYHALGSRSDRLIAKRLDRIAHAVALTDDDALLSSFSLRVQSLCRQLQVVTRTIATYDQRIEQAFKAHPDAVFFANLPGAGPALAPRLLVAFGSQRDRYPTRESMQRYSGIAPVTKQSGGKCHIHRRYCCPKFLRQSFHEFAGQSILHCRWAAAFYLQLREKGAKHHTAVRALAYKWQRIIWRCWQDETVYEDRIYEQALRRSKSPIISLFKRVEVGHNPAKEQPTKTS